MSSLLRAVAGLTLPQARPTVWRVVEPLRKPRWCWWFGCARLASCSPWLPDTIVALVLLVTRDGQNSLHGLLSPTLWSYANIPAAARRGAAAIDEHVGSLPWCRWRIRLHGLSFGAFADEQHPPASLCALCCLATVCTSRARQVHCCSKPALWALP